VKHKDRRDPKEWKGFKFAVPFDYSMHNFLLRYYVAEHASIRTPTSRSACAAAGNGGQSARRQHRRLPRPDPFNQRAVYDEVASSTSCPRTLTGTPAAPSAFPRR